MEFQLHHTGIKTVDSFTRVDSVPYFNCTIQELKHGRWPPLGPLTQGFQLHHTGIKTLPGLAKSFISGTFQLHHTGIKTVLRTTKVTCGKRISIAPYRN